MRGRVERLAGLEQLAAEVAREESAAVAGGAVEHEHRVSHDAARVLSRLAERGVMDAEDGQRRPSVNRKSRISKSPSVPWAPSEPARMHWRDDDGE